MKRRSTKWFWCLLTAALACLLAGVSAAETKTAWNYTFEVQEDGTAVITEYRGNDQELVIPADLDGYPVVGIADSVFELKRTLTSVEIPSGVVHIGSKAFSSCDSIEKVSLPKTLKSLGSRAFSNCKSLHSIELPAGLETIGNNPFARSDNLTEVTFAGGSNEFYEIRDSAIVNKAEKKLVTWLHETDGQGVYTVPEDIRIIGDSAFTPSKKRYS